MRAGGGRVNDGDAFRGWLPTKPYQQSRLPFIAQQCIAVAFVQIPVQIRREPIPLASVRKIFKPQPPFPERVKIRRVQ